MQIVFDLTALKYWGEFSPADLLSGNKMIGGTESASMYMAKTMKELGEDVIVFRPSNNKIREEFDGVSYMPSESFLPYVESYEDIDIIITANCGLREVFANKEINAKLKVDYVSCAAVYMSPEYEANTDVFLYMSEFQKKYISRMGIPENKLLKFKFGYDPALANNISFNKRKNRIIYASSPDRGLHDAIDIFIEMRKSNPELELHVFYDVINWLNANKYSMFAPGVRAAKILKNWNTPGIVWRGPVSYVEMQKEFSEAIAMVYPFSSIQPTETSPRTVIEAIAAGTPVFLSPNDCLEELYKDRCYVAPIDTVKWAKDINDTISTLDNWNEASCAQLNGFDDTWQNTVTDLLANLKSRIK